MNLSGAEPVSGYTLVATKLLPPPPRIEFIDRPDLVAQLIAGHECKLALVCAPAGWGKTVLLSQWHRSAEEQRRFGWVSLDRGDADPVRFWSYAIAALHTIEPELGRTALAALPAAGPDLVEAVVAPLINDLAALSQPCVLVLDDYHLVHGEAIRATVAFFVQHLPAGVQLAIASRADPALRLARLRTSGEMIEIRAADLRFSAVEAEALLNGMLTLGLGMADIELLQQRTEGWAAGLQLAGLSLQTETDRHAFVDAFAGDDRQIGEYLHDVLREQPTALGDFLVRTSVLERMCAPLCDAVTGRDDATAMLEQIHRANLFLVPLDSRNLWYRYHHLFRDLLRQELAMSAPALSPELHRRASLWHQAEGSVDEAIGHATAAGDFSAAAELIASNWRHFVFQLGEVKTAARWLDSVSRESAMNDPRLCLARGWIALVTGRHREVPIWVEAASSAAARSSPPGPLADIATSIESAISQLDAAHAALSGDIARAKRLGRRSLELEPDESSPGYGAASINFGATLYFAGELAEAGAAVTNGLRDLEDHQSRTAVMGGLGYLALIHLESGREAEAERITSQVERLIETWDRANDVWTTPALIARGKLLEQGSELAGAETAYTRAAVLARRGTRRLDLTLALISLARLKRNAHDHAGARTLAREAREALAACPDPGVLTGQLARTERALQLAPAPDSAPVLAADLELSERELTILRLLASDLSQREIGSELFISFDTVKGHVRSIFRKLGVHSRAGAVERGRELRLI